MQEEEITGVDYMTKEQIVEQIELQKNPYFKGSAMRPELIEAFNILMEQLESKESKVKEMPESLAEHWGLK